MEYATRAEDSAAHSGWLQQVDPRVKLGGLLSLVLAAIMAQRITVILGIFVVGILMVSLSGIARSLVKLWLGILVFSGAIVLPALFTTPGLAVWHVPWLGWPVSASGLRSAMMLMARSETSATLAKLMVLTTPWPHVLKALRIFRMPIVFIMILGMTHRYIFVLLQIARDFFEARRARRVGTLDAAQRRRMAVSSAAVLLNKSIGLSSEVYDAMRARGFRGNVYTIDEFRMKRRDWSVLAGFGVLIAMAVWLGKLWN
jgi:cobalt ECF transporter T component CbiQ